jgi:hypothetical protein
MFYMGTRKRYMWKFLAASILLHSLKKTIYGFGVFIITWSFYITIPPPLQRRENLYMLLLVFVSVLCNDGVFFTLIITWILLYSFRLLCLQYATRPVVSSFRSGGSSSFFYGQLNNTFSFLSFLISRSKKQKQTTI